jgi:outer membrane lipoprotein-sorting protein
MPYILTMPKIRILPAFAVALIIPLAVWAQGPTGPTPPAGAAGSVGKAADPSANEPPTEADKQVDAAVKLVAALKSVSANVLQKVDLLDQKFDVAGRFLKAPNNRVYLNLKVSGLADASGQTLQVCDGQTLWDYQQILDSQNYRRIAVTQVFQKLSSPDIDPELRTQVLAQLGFSGPEELLRGLRKAVRFTQKDPDTVDGKDVWILRGEWRDRTGLLGANNQPLPPTMPLPAYVPSLVILTVGQDDGWPYKLRLVGKRPTMLMDTRKVGPDGRPIGSRSQIADVKPTEIELSYSNVKLNPDLKLEEFVFQAPPGARVEDSTQALVTMLDQAIQLSAAKKRAEAGKAEDPLLNQKIEIPKAGEGVGPGARPPSELSPVVPSTPGGTAVPR